jgi:hypothetical protein
VTRQPAPFLPAAFVAHRPKWIRRDAVLDTGGTYAELTVNV